MNDKENNVRTQEIYKMHKSDLVFDLFWYCPYCKMYIKYSSDDDYKLGENLYCNECHSEFSLKD